MSIDLKLLRFSTLQRVAEEAERDLGRYRPYLSGAPRTELTKSLQADAVGLQKLVQEANDELRRRGEALTL